MNTTPLEKQLLAAGLPVIGTATPRAEHGTVSPATFYTSNPQATAAGMVVRADWSRALTAGEETTAAGIVPGADLRDRRLRKRSAILSAVQALSAAERNRLMTAANSWGDDQDVNATGADLVVLWLRAVPDGGRRLSPPIAVDGDEAV